MVCNENTDITCVGLNDIQRNGLHEMINRSTIRIPSCGYGKMQRYGNYKWECPLYDSSTCRTNKQVIPAIELLLI